MTSKTILWLNYNSRNFKTLTVMTFLECKLNAIFMLRLLIFFTALFWIPSSMSSLGWERSNAQGQKCSDSFVFHLSVQLNVGRTSVKPWINDCIITRTGSSIVYWVWIRGSWDVYLERSVRALDRYILNYKTYRINHTANSES